MTAAEFAREEAHFPDTFRRAIEHRRLSLSELQRRLVDSGNPVALSTLSSWRTGARRPEGAQSRAALAELERLLGLNADTLISLIGHTRRPGHAPGPGPVFSDHYERIRSETIAALDVDPLEHFREVSSSTFVHVGTNGGVAEQRTRTLLQATTRAVRSVPLLVALDEAGISGPEFYVDGGGRLSGTFTHPEGGLAGARIELDRPLESPDALVLEYGFALAAGDPPQRHAAHLALRRIREMILGIQFSPGAVPEWVREFEEDAEEKRDFPARTLAGTSAHAVRRQFGPGMLGIAWGS